MRLQPDEPVVHVHAGQLQFARPTDVAGLVEACLQLEHDGDLLAGFGGANEVPGDLAVSRRSVEGHLDREHFGVAGGLLDERLGRRGERLVRVVHQQLPRADDLEHRLSRFGGCRKSARGHRSPGREAQFRPVEVRQLRQGRHLDERIVADDVGWFEFQLGAHAGEHDLGDVRLHLETNRPAESATTQLHLHGGEQVLGVLVVEREVGVSRHPEARDADDLHSREQPIEMRLDEVLEQDEVVRIGHGYEARKVARHLHSGEPLVAVDRVAHDDRQVQRQVGDVRKRVRRVDCQRGEDREDSVLVVGGQRVLCSLAELRPAHHADTFTSERRKQLVAEQSFLRDHEPLHAHRDGVSLLLGRHSVEALL